MIRGRIRAGHRKIIPVHGDESRPLLPGSNKRESSVARGLLALCLGVTAGASGLGGSSPGNPFEVLSAQAQPLPNGNAAPIGGPPAGLPIPGAIARTPPSITPPPVPPQVIEQAARRRTGAQSPAAVPSTATAAAQTDAAPKRQVQSLPPNLPLPGEPWRAPPTEIATPVETPDEPASRIAAAPPPAEASPAPVPEPPSDPAQIAAVPAAPVQSAPLQAAPAGSAGAALLPPPALPSPGPAANNTPHRLALPPSVAATPLLIPPTGDSRVATSSAPNTLPTLPEMRPPPLHSELLGPSGDPGAPTPPPVAQPGLGPSALASPIGVEGVMGETGESDSPRTEDRADIAGPATGARAGSSAATVDDVAPAPLSAGPTRSEPGSAPEARPAEPVPPLSVTAQTDAIEELPALPSIDGPAGTMDLGDQVSDLPPPPVLPELDEPIRAGAQSETRDASASPRTPGQVVDETYQRRLADSSPDRRSAPASSIVQPTQREEARGGERVAALEAPRRTPPEAIGVPTPGVKPYLVEFAFSSADLTDEGRRIIQQVVDAYRGAPGKRIRIVGHASSKTVDMAVGDHMLANFEMSLKRATAVSDELMRLGVDPGHVVVEAVGDRQPLYYEAMPTGEAGNRRAEIYLE